MTDTASSTDAATGGTASESTQEDTMPPRARTTEKADTEGADRASVVAPPSPGFASDLDVEQAPPMHYLKHRRTGEITSVGDHGSYLELAQAGWELTTDTPPDAPAATGGPAI